MVSRELSLLDVNEFGAVSESNHNINSKTTNLGFPGGAVVKNLPANAGDTGSSPCLGLSFMP